MRECIIEAGSDVLPFQTFRGKKYHLYNGEKYYSRGTKRLHVVVFETFNGKVPKGFHVHHMDENTANNDIDNLGLLPGRDHCKLHMAKRDPALMRAIMDNARKYASEWHGSPEGIEWHKKQGSETLQRLAKEKVKKFCEECGKEYECPISRASASKFCSNNCKSQSRRKSGIDNITIECNYCGRSFVKDKYSRAIHCSKSCSKKAEYRKASAFY